MSSPDDRKEIASALGEAYDEERGAGTWQRIVQSRAARAGRARWVLPAVATAGAIAVAVVVMSTDDGAATRTADHARPGPLVSVRAEANATSDVAVGAVV